MSSLAPIRAHASTRLRVDSAFTVQDTPPRPPLHANMPLMQLCEHVYLVRFCCACLCIQSAYRQWAECWLSFGLLVHVLPYTWICWVLDRNRGSVALVRQHLVPALSFFLRVRFVWVVLRISRYTRPQLYYACWCRWEIMWSTLAAGPLCCCD